MSSSSSSSSDDDEILTILANASEQGDALIQQLIRSESSDEEKRDREDSVIPMMQMSLDAMNSLLNPPKRRKGSQMGRRYTYRNHNLSAQRLEENYFKEGSTFNDDQFKDRFRVGRRTFDRIYSHLENHPLFVRKFDAAGKSGIHPKVKATIAFRFLGYGCPVRVLDETYYIGIQTAFNAIDDFCTAMNEIFGATYLRSPNNHDMEMILADADERGWPGCLGSLDCTTWRWEMCPVALAGQYTGYEHEPVIQMEALCGHDGWIWNYVFGLAGGMNDLTILEHSNIFREYFTGKQPPVLFTVNGKPYNIGYYLCDGIYREWASLINAIKSSNGEAEKYFTLRQESTCKDIECVFGRMKKKWGIFARPARFHRIKTLGDVMNTCINLHNMGVHKRCQGNERDFVPDEVPRQELYPEGTKEYIERELLPKRHGWQGIEERFGCASLGQEASNGRRLKLFNGR